MPVTELASLTADALSACRSLSSRPYWREPAQSSRFVFAFFPAGTYAVRTLPGFVLLLARSAQQRRIRGSHTFQRSTRGAMPLSEYGTELELDQGMELSA